MGWKESYNQKLRTLAEAALAVRSGDLVAATPGSSFPLELANAVAARDDLEEVTILSALMVKLPDYLTPDHPSRDRIHYHSLYMGPLERFVLSQGLSITPGSVHFSDLATYIQRAGARVALCEVSPPDAQGFVSLGPMGAMPGVEAVAGSEWVVAQVNRHVPRVSGVKARLHVDEIDAFVEHDTPMFEVPDLGEPAGTEKAIADIVGEMVPDGATIQIGLGKMADAICRALRNKKELGIHSELVTGEMLSLQRRGVVTNQHKTVHPGKTIAAFCLGRAEDYAFLHDNPEVEFYPSAYVNRPELIARNAGAYSINSTLSVDLTGQASSESFGFSQYSGTGGQLDFVRGARNSRGGASILTLKSTATVNGTRFSRIVTGLEPGTAVTTPRSDIHHVVTEFGSVDLSCRSLPDRARALIGIAHPDFREGLMRHAVDHGIIPTTKGRQRHP